jgi:hypothetical protein
VVILRNRFHFSTVNWTLPFISTSPRKESNERYGKKKKILNLQEKKNTKPARAKRIRENTTAGERCEWILGKWKAQGAVIIKLTEQNEI